MQNQPGLFYEFPGYNQKNLTPEVFPILKFQQENESVGSPTLTTNSGRSEITEASADFCFPAGQQESLSFGLFPQLNPMQQPSYEDMRLLQQHTVSKQMQDLQRRNQLQQFGDTRPQISLNPFSTIHKQAASGQFPPLVDGMPMPDASQVYVNWAQRGAGPTQQGTPNRTLLSLEQGQALRSMGLAPQQLDASLYGTPVTSSRGNLSQQSPIQGMYQESHNLFGKMGGQAQNFGHPFLKNQFNFSQDQISLQQGVFMQNQGFPGKNIFGSGPVHGLNSGLVLGNLQVGNSQQSNASLKDFDGRQGQVGWSDIQQKATELSQAFVPLDPIEQKILFNMDDNSWDVSLGKVPDIGSGALGGMFDNNDVSNAFPSIQSGSWSALMQSAVAEASSSDTGHQEEWSGLTFQNTEPSGDNQASNFIDSDKQQTCWVNNSLQSTVPISSKSLPTLYDLNMNSGFANSQQPDNQLLYRQKEAFYQDSNPESIERTARVTGQWVDCSPRQKHSIEANQHVQPYMHPDDSRMDQIHKCSTGMVANPPSCMDDLHVSNTAAPPGIASQFNLDDTQFASQQKSETPHGKQSPISGAAIGSQTSQQGVFHARLYNVWTNVPTRQQTSVPESLKDSFSSFADVNDPTNQQNMSFGMNNPPQMGYPQVQEASAKYISDASASGSLHTHSPPTRPNGMRPGNDHGLTTTSCHSLRPASSFPQNYPRLHPVAVMNTADTDANRRNLKTNNISDLQRVAAMMGHIPYQQNSGLKAPGDIGLNSMQPNSSASGANKMLGFMMEAREDQSVEALSQLTHPDGPSPAMVALRQTHSQTQSNDRSLLASRTEHGQLNLNSLSALFKQSGAFRSGQMLPVYDSSHAKVSGACAPHDASTGPSRETIFELPKNQDIAMMRPKKRKFIAHEQLAWHKEVSQISLSDQGISVANQEWAEATNRLLEKMEDEVEMIECAKTVPRSKRRLISTSQLMQHLFCPPPAFFFSENSVVHYDSLLYFVTRATLGNGCSLANSGRNQLPSPSDETDMTAEKGKTLERWGRPEYGEAFDKLIEKAKKLESEFQRLEKASSIVDIRLEFQDLERFGVINRFARFHSRAQVDTSENSLTSVMPKPILQRICHTINLEESHGNALQMKNQRPTVHEAKSALKKMQKLLEVFTTETSPKYKKSFWGDI